MPLPLPLPPHVSPGQGDQGGLGEGGWEGGEESDAGHTSNTIKRRAKRDRDRNHVRTGNGGGQQARETCQQPAVNHVSNHAGYRRQSKSRSKSRSPGREIDRAAIVIVHHHTCAGHVSGHVSRPRTASPDNLSESSISFHENEVNFDLSPGSMAHAGDQCEPMPDPPGHWYDGHTHEQCVSVCRDTEPVTPVVTNSHRTIQYSNWESCRESWFSSGSSELRPSSGSDCPPPPPRHSDQGATMVMRSGVAPDSSVKTVRPGLVNNVGAGPNTLPRSAVQSGLRQSSRESNSSSSRPSSRPGTRPNTR